MVSKKNDVVYCNFNFKRISGSSKNAIITTLPSEYIPTKDICFSISITDGSATLKNYLATVYIYTNGQVIFYCPTSIGADMFFAGGIAFVI